MLALAAVMRYIVKRIIEAFTSACNLCILVPPPVPMHPNLDPAFEGDPSVPADPA